MRRNNRNPQVMSKSVRGTSSQRNRQDDVSKQNGRLLSALEDDVESVQQTRKIDDFIANTERMIEGLQAGLVAFKSEIPTIKANLQGNQESADNINVIIDTLTEKCTDLEAENRKLSSDKQKLEEGITRMNTKLEKMDDKVRNMSSELEQAKTELDLTRTRLSEVLGYKLTDNNAEIADLSDKNRPSKLADRCSEIYDNEWTDAYEAVQKVKSQSEEECVSILLKMLKMVNKFCLDRWQSYVADYQRVITREKDRPISAYLQKQLKDVAKVLASNMHEDIFQEFLSERVPNVSEENRILFEPPPIQSFLKTCVELCWLMAVQDPPVVFKMDFKPGVKFDQNTFRAFTKNGSKLKFVVWPPLYLQDGGALLGKGVAQGFGDERPSSAPAKFRESSKKQSNAVFSSTLKTTPKKAWTNETEAISKEKTSEYQNSTVTEFQYTLLASRQPSELMPELPIRPFIEWKYSRTPKQGELDTFVWFVKNGYYDSQIKAQMGTDLFQMCKDYNNYCEKLQEYSRKIKNEKKAIRSDF